METMPSKLLVSLMWVALGTCLMLLIIDIKLKNDIVAAAVHLEERIDHGNRTFIGAEFTDIYGDIPPSVPTDLQNGHHATMAEGSANTEIPEVNPSDPPKTRRRTGNTGKGIPQEGE